MVIAIVLEQETKILNVLAKNLESKLKRDTAEQVFILKIKFNIGESVYNDFVKRFMVYALSPNFYKCQYLG